MKVANTLFEKPPQKLITYKENKAHPRGPPWTRYPYETLDYILVQNRWKNSITNLESDVYANIASDHFPLWMRIRIKLKAPPVKSGRAIK